MTPTVQRLSRDQMYATIVENAQAGRFVLVSLKSHRALRSVFDDLRQLDWPELTVFRLANGNERIQLAEGGRVVFDAICGHYSPDVAILSSTYGSSTFGALVASMGAEAELYEVDL